MRICLATVRIDRSPRRARSKTARYCQAAWPFSEGVCSISSTSDPQPILALAVKTGYQKLWRAAGDFLYKRAEFSLEDIKFYASLPKLPPPDLIMMMYRNFTSLASFPVSQN